MNRSTKLRVALSLGITACLVVGALYLWSGRHSRARDVVPSSAAAVAAKSSSSRPALREPGQVVLSHLPYPVPQGAVMTPAQWSSMRDLAPRIFQAYAAGSYSSVCRELTANRGGEVPHEWSNANEAEADRVLSWFYESLTIADQPGTVRTLNIAKGESLRDALRYPMGNSMIGTHESGLGVLDRSGAARLVCEVVQPVSYFTADGQEQHARLGVHLCWDPSKECWTQVGMSLYDFTVGKPLPMMPY